MAGDSSRVPGLCKLYGVQKLRTLLYHAQTNGQVEQMNQTIIRMIGKLGEDQKAHWSEHLPELLLAYNANFFSIRGLRASLNCSLGAFKFFTT